MRAASASANKQPLIRFVVTARKKGGKKTSSKGGKPGVIAPVFRLITVNLLQVERKRKGRTGGWKGKESTDARQV